MSATATEHRAITEADREKMLVKLRKLSNKEADARERGSMAEAETFAAKIAELLALYNLAMADVDAVDLETSEPIVQVVVDPRQHNYKYVRKRVAWQEDLARVIANNFFCKWLLRTGSNYIWFVGRKTNVEQAIYTYTFLVREIERISYKAYCDAYSLCVKQGRSVQEVAGYQPSFRAGAVDGLAIRFREDRKKLEQGHGDFTDYALDTKNLESRFALVRKTEAENVEEWLRQKRGGRKVSAAAGIAGTQKQWNGSARSAGRDFGQAVNITKGVGSGKGVKGTLG